MNFIVYLCDHIQSFWFIVLVSDDRWTDSTICGYAFFARSKTSTSSAGVTTQSALLKTWNWWGGEVSSPVANNWSMVAAEGWNCKSDIAAIAGKVFSVSATSAPVQHIFCQSGLTMSPKQAKLGNNFLSQLMFLKCNRHLWL